MPITPYFLGLTDEIRSCARYGFSIIRIALSPKPLSLMNCAAERLGSGSAIVLLSQFDVSSADDCDGSSRVSLEPLTLFTSGMFTSSIRFNYNKKRKSVVGFASNPSTDRLSDRSPVWILPKFRSKLCRVSSTGSFNGSVRRPLQK